MSGLGQLQEWLGTEVYQCDYRPVPLREFYLASDYLCSMADSQKLVKLSNNLNGLSDPHGAKVLQKPFRDNIAILAATYARKNKASIVFCGSKKQCEDVSLKLQRLFPKIFRGQTQNSEFKSLE